MRYEITSPANERIKNLIRLRDRRQRDAAGVFVVEGPRLVDRALAAGLSPVVIYVDGSVPVDVDGVVTVKPEALSRASYRQRSEGVIAVFEQFSPTFDLLQPDPGSLLLGAESLEKPGNLGAMLRTADACGAGGFVVVDPTVDLFNPNVIRASTGALFSVPTVVCTSDELEPWLTANSIRLVGTSPESPTTLWEADLTGGLLALVGPEASGLSERTRHRCDQLVSIPMAGLTDSLNASVTLALIAYESVRQRGHRHH